MFDQILRYPLSPFPMERRWKSSVEQAPNCPRCASPNTKFCYYNNYSLSQPRYFCKGCRRYWTKGGSLRNVPVGGGCRRGRRTKSTKPTFTPSHTLNPPSPHPLPSEVSSEIDLAAVFAKYLNQNQNPLSGNKDYSSGTSSGSFELPLSSTQQENFFDDGFEFLDQEVNAFELQGLLSDDVVSHSPTFEWQQIAHLQEFGTFSTDEEMMVPGSGSSNNWGSFDPLGYEIFSRP